MATASEGLISVDDHVLEPPHLWQNWVPAKYRDRAPKMFRKGDEEWWEYDGQKVPTPGLSAVAGKKADEFGIEPMRYDEMRPGCYDPLERVKDMNQAGVLASLCFPSFARFCGQRFMNSSDRDLDLACVRGYNDWMIEEWAGSAPGRFIPLIIIPLWDPALAAAEVSRCAEKGARGMCFSENPVHLGLPSIHDRGGYWDPIWAACDEANLVVCMHIGSSNHDYAPAPDSPQVVRKVTSAAFGIMGAMMDWLFGPPFLKHSNLRIALSEGGIGWMPYFLEAASYTVHRHRSWINRYRAISQGVYTEDDSLGIPSLEEFDVYRVFRDHIFGCFIDDIHGMKSAPEIGLNNIMIETDYPHSDSTWPNCIEHAAKQLEIANVTELERYNILRGNAERVFAFKAADVMPGR